MAPEVVEAKDCPSSRHAKSGLLHNQQRARHHRQSKYGHQVAQHDDTDSDDTEGNKKSGIPRPASCRVRRTGIRSTSTKKHNSKIWTPIFLQEREVADISFFEVHKTTGSKRGLVETFLQEDFSPVPSLQIEHGRAFFTAGQNDVQTWSSRPRAWVYRHTESEHVSDASASHMTALQLAGLTLKKPGLNVCKQGDVHRVLVHVNLLTLDYAMALVRTVSQNNVAALRAALLGHIARVTALRVTTSLKGFPTFRMELHLPYLTLRKDQATLLLSCMEPSKRSTKVWADLTFLDHYICNKDLRGRSIYAAHATIVVSGWDGSKYTAYSFLDPGPAIPSTGDEEQDDDSDEEDDPEVAEKLDPELLPEDAEDKFATYGWQDCLHLNDSISSWDPRVRFLRGVQIKVTVALQEYEYMIGSLCDVMTWIEDNLFPATHIFNSQDCQMGFNQKDLSECVRRITILLVRLREQLAETIRAWTKFMDKHGDIAYFADLSDRMADEAIDSMRDSFKDLVGLEQKISSLEETCRIWARTLDTALSQESNNITRQALQSNFVAVKLGKQMTDLGALTFRVADNTSRITHMSVYMVLATAPCIMALQYFTSEQPLFSFERNPRTFFVSILILGLGFFACAFVLYGFDTYKSTLSWYMHTILWKRKRPPQKRLSDTVDEILEQDYLHEPTSTARFPVAVV